MIRVYVTDDTTGREGCASIPSDLGPSLRSFIGLVRNDLGERASGSYRFEKEDALTRATAAFGPLAAAINQALPVEDPDFD